MVSSSSSCSFSSHNWVYDVFPSFRGEDVRISFISHLYLALSRKLISAFKDNEIERSHLISTALARAIKNSRIAIVVFTRNYASSSWCLNELAEIVKWKDQLDQRVIPIFYGLDPSHVRNQTGDFGKAFEKTSQNKTEAKKQLWEQALTVVANIAGYHSSKWDNEASMIEKIVDDVLDKLKLTPSMDFIGFVGMEDHIANMSSMLRLESEEVRMVGIWGPSGIGKTSIGRAIYSRISRHFQGSVFIDKAFISKTMNNYSRANPYDYNMKLHLQRTFLAEILDKENIKIDNLGAVSERLRHQKVLIVLDDLDDQVVLDTLTGQTQWFGHGSRVIAITKDKNLLRAHRIKHIYEVLLPSKSLALEMLCQSAFGQNSPPLGFSKMAYEVTECAGSLPLGLSILGSYLRRRSQKDWLDMMPRLQNSLDGKIERSLRVSYDGLDSKKDQAIFRHIACLFNFEDVNVIKKLLADSHLDVNIGLKNLEDKSLIRIRTSSETVEMHCLVQEMGKEVVRTQSVEPGKREFLVDWKDVRAVFKEKTTTEKVLGISLDIMASQKLRIYKRAFKKVPKLRFLKLYFSEIWDEESKCHLPEGLEYLPPKLRLLCWDAYPIRYLPTNFRAEHLVELKMIDSELEKLWDGAQSLTCLKDMDLTGSKNLKELPDLSGATNLEKLNLSYCSSLVELPYSIRYLNKLLDLDMAGCTKLETLPTGINLESLYCVVLDECSLLKSLPDISDNISVLSLDYTSIKEFPSKWRLVYLVNLSMNGIENEKLWEGVQPLPFLEDFTLSDSKNLKEIPDLSMARNLIFFMSSNCPSLVELSSFRLRLCNLKELRMRTCSSLRTFPDFSANISKLNLDQTLIEEVPRWIEKFSKLETLSMARCNNLKYVPPNMYKLKLLEKVNFSDCGALTEASWHGCSRVVSSLAKNCYPKFKVNFINCFNLDQETLIQQKSAFKRLILPGEEVPPYFTHQTIGSIITIPLLLQNSLSQQFFGFRACLTVEMENSEWYHGHIKIDIHVQCHYKGKTGIHTDFSQYQDGWSRMKDSHLLIFDYHFILNRENSPSTELNCDEVEIKFHIDKCQILGCGIQLCEVWEGDESNDDNDLGSHTDHCDEFGDSYDSDQGRETDESEEYEYSDDSDMGYEECEDGDIRDDTGDSGTSGDSDSGTTRSSKRMRVGI